MISLNDPLVWISLALLAVALWYVLRGRSAGAPLSLSPMPADEALRVFEDDMARRSRIARADIIARAQAQADLQAQAERLDKAWKSQSGGDSPKSS